jgi:hypothetical protein
MIASAVLTRANGERIKKAGARPAFFSSDQGGHAKLRSEELPRHPEDVIEADAIVF